MTNGFRSLVGVILGISVVSASEARAELIQFPIFSDAQIQVIYGDDNRKDLYQETDARLRQLADSTVAMIERNKITFNGDRANLAADRYSEAYNLCSDEPFFSQSTVADCSGTLVGTDLVLTAGHCVNADTCGEVAFVFGFAVNVPGADFIDQVRAQDVYNCRSVVAHHRDDTGSDYAVVKLDRTVMDHAAVAIRRTGQPSVGMDLVVIGHPSGLPVKIAGGAKVRTITGNGYFQANLDTYGGNSGSAVFNAQTGEIEGVLVRGETDYEMREIESTGDYCRQSNRCDNEGCRGEDVTLISEVAPFIPAL